MGTVGIAELQLENALGAYLCDDATFLVKHV